jgi:hypothetical protein
LEHCKTMDQALAHINSSPVLQSTNPESHIFPSTLARDNLVMEMEL